MTMPTLAIPALPSTLGVGSLGTLDWAIVGLYLAIILVSGWWLARREPSGAREYFIAGRRMPVWAVVCSIIASSLSVATFIGGPDMSFKGDLTYLSTNIGGIIAIFVVAWVFIPAFYKADVISIYELLERRMGRNAKQAASAAFMVGRTFASGARVYIGAIPIAAVVFGIDQSTEPGPLIIAISLLCAAAVFYTLVGGIASVIWTDVIQTVVMLVAVIAAIAFILSTIPAGTGQMVEALSTAGADGSSKLKLISFDLGGNFTIFTAVVGFMLLGLASYGTDHDMVQRMLTCKNAAKGGRSAITAILIAIPIVALFLLIGLLLFVFYKQPSLMGGVTPKVMPAGDQQPFLVFIVNELPTGLAGLMVAGLFAVGLGSLNSAINAMAATFIRDFYSHWFPGRSDKHYLSAGRWAVAGWGAVLGGFAIFCIYWKRANPQDTLIDFALRAMTFAFAGLLAVFLTVLLTRRGSGPSAIAALITGFVVILLFQTPFCVAVSSALTSTNYDAESIKNLLPWLALPWPWHLPIGVALSMGVCCLGRPRSPAVPA